MGLVDLSEEERVRQSEELWTWIRQSQTIAGVLADVGTERHAQIKKWGEQHHPDGTSERYGIFADEFRKQTDEADRNGSLSWVDILSEEYYEALAETDPAKLRAELVQVAAVAAAWIEDIDSRKEQADGVGQ